MKDCLIIFAKEPKADMVKTRLSKRLSNSKCVSLYRAFLKDTIGLAKNIKCEDRIMAYDPSAGRPEYLKRIARNFVFYKQSGRNLGQRMHNAFRFAGTFADRTVIIGSDSPSLPRRLVREAFNKLDRSDVVLGPSDDGGYYLIGLKKPCAGLFKGVKWSSSQVLEETIKKANLLKKRLAILRRWYDVDDAKALECLKQDLKKDTRGETAKWTRRFLRV